MDQFTFAEDGVVHFSELPEQTKLTTQCKNTTDDHHSVRSLIMDKTNKRDNVFIGKPCGRRHFGGLGC
jgi:hypothetical protein